MSVLVLGSRGQLAQHLRDTLAGARYWGRREYSLEDPLAAETAMVEAAPSIIVNAAAYTAVDQAEKEPEAAWRINAEGAACAARAAARLGVPIIQVSTDYVFDGSSDRAYRDTDATLPTNVYGRTKLAGELAVASIAPKHWILRASWVFSELDGNFLTTMLRLANERDRLRVVADQHGRPTYAGDLARVISRLVTDRTAPMVPWGIHHVSGGDAISWHGFAEHIIETAFKNELVERRPYLEAIGTAEYPTLARRPMNSVLEPSRSLTRELNMQPDWRAGVQEVITRLRGSRRR